MVRAWYMDDDPSDQRNEHHRNPPAFIDIDDLKKVSGVEYFKVRSIYVSNSRQFPTKIIVEPGHVFN